MNIKTKYNLNLNECSFTNIEKNKIVLIANNEVNSKKREIFIKENIKKNNFNYEIPDFLKTSPSKINKKKLDPSSKSNSKRLLDINTSKTNIINTNICQYQYRKDIKNKNQILNIKVSRNEDSNQNLKIINSNNSKVKYNSTEKKQDKSPSNLSIFSKKNKHFNIKSIDEDAVRSRLDKIKLEYKKNYKDISNDKINRSISSSISKIHNLNKQYTNIVGHTDTNRISSINIMYNNKKFNNKSRTKNSTENTFILNNNNSPNLNYILKKCENNINSITNYEISKSKDNIKRAIRDEMHKSNENYENSIENQNLFSKIAELKKVIIEKDQSIIRLNNEISSLKSIIESNNLNQERKIENKKSVSKGRRDNTINQIEKQKLKKMNNKTENTHSTISNTKLSENISFNKTDLQQQLKKIKERTETNFGLSLKIISNQNNNKSNDDYDVNKLLIM